LRGPRTSIRLRRTLCWRGTIRLRRSAWDILGRGDGRPQQDHRGQKCRVPFQQTGVLGPRRYLTSMKCARQLLYAQFRLRRRVEPARQSPLCSRHFAAVILQSSLPGRHLAFVSLRSSVCKHHANIVIGEASPSPPLIIKVLYAGTGDLFGTGNTI
jgi:hypothetical protein